MRVADNVKDALIVIESHYSVTEKGPGRIATAESSRPYVDRDSFECGVRRQHTWQLEASWAIEGGKENRYGVLSPWNHESSA